MTQFEPISEISWVITGRLGGYNMGVRGQVKFYPYKRGNRIALAIHVLKGYTQSCCILSRGYMDTTCSSLPVGSKFHMDVAFSTSLTQ